MVYTITFNPAIDRILKFKDDFKLNTTNRANYDQKYAAGKGIHIAKMLSNLGDNCKALYLSGKNDSWFQQDLKDQNIDGVSFEAGGNIRTNLKLISKSQQTESNGLGLKGPFEKAVEKMCIYLKNNLKKKDFIIIAGSFPNGFTKELLKTCLETIKLKTKNLIVDTSNKEMLNIFFQYNPIFIKPNENEMKDLENFGYSKEEILKSGVKNIVMSKGKNGAVLVNSEEIIDFKIDKEFKVKNLAGSGDSMIAGIMYKIKRGFSIKDSIKFGLICGTATATSDEIANAAQVKKIDKELEWNQF